MAPADQDAVTRVLVNMGKSIAAFLRSLRVTESPLDAYASGQLDALTAQQRTVFWRSYRWMRPSAIWPADRWFVSQSAISDWAPGPHRRPGPLGWNSILACGEFRQTGKYSDAFLPHRRPTHCDSESLRAFKTLICEGLRSRSPSATVDLRRAHVCYRGSPTAGLSNGQHLDDGDAERFLVSFDPTSNRDHHLSRCSEAGHGQSSAVIHLTPRFPTMFPVFR